jgi:hypothetical protein
MFLASQTNTAEELRLECMFPADEVTESRHNQFIAAHSPARIVMT